MWKCAALLLGYASPSAVDAYGERIKELPQRYPWEDVARGDDYMRRDNWERIKRGLETKGRTATWSDVLLKSAESDSFWATWVKEPYLLRAERSQPHMQGQQDKGHGKGNDVQKQEKGHGKGKKKQKRPGDGKRGSGRTATGEQICFRYNRGACELPCPEGRAHCCEVCMTAGHPKKECRYHNTA